MEASFLFRVHKKGKTNGRRRNSYMTPPLQVDTKSHAEKLLQNYDLEVGAPLSDQGPTFSERDLISQMFTIGNLESKFTGSEATIWLCKHFDVPPSVAVEIGNKLLKKGYFKGVGVHVFADENNFLYEQKEKKTEISYPFHKIIGDLQTIQQSDSYSGNKQDLEFTIRVLKNKECSSKDSAMIFDNSNFILNSPRQKKTNASLEEIFPGGNNSQNLSEDPIVQQTLKDCSSWDFPIFSLNRNSRKKPLLYMGYALFLQHDLINKFKIPQEKLRRWLEKMNEGYRNNPYHNAIHAADVSQTLNFFLTKGGLEGKMTDNDLFAAIVAAICHDFDHPGYNNAFLVNAKSDLALRYNDSSVLENHHLSASFFLLSKEEYNIFENCNPEVYKEIRETIIRCVLATDFAKHFDLLNQFKSKASSGMDFNRIEDRRLVLQLALKCADVSHTAKSGPTHIEWTNRVTKEFYMQGDAEKKNKMPLSPNMDRKNSDLPKSQVGFISFLVLPLYKAWSEMFDESKICLDALQSNLDNWKVKASVKEKVSPQPKKN